MSSASTPLPTPHPSTARSSFASKLGKATLRITLGLALGAVIAEGAFWWRDQGAFPHVNFYEADAELGVHLRAGAEERIRFSGNPVTHVRINRQGFRGGDFAEPATQPGVIVVGDSQVFGLGVEEGDTFSAQLASALGGKRDVRNLGVPTYGPSEYNAVVAKWLPLVKGEGRERVVVYVVNLSNDLFEATRLNRERHGVWDGWAVRKETAPQVVRNFPGRRFVFSESHAVYALRRWLYERGPKLDDRGFVSEGTFHDISGAAATALENHRVAEDERDRLVRERETSLRYARDRVESVERQIDSALYTRGSRVFAGEGIGKDEDRLSRWDVVLAARMSPGDILTIDSGEAARDVRVTAEHIKKGAELRREAERVVRADAEAKQDKDMLALFKKRDDVAQRNEALIRAPVARTVATSPLLPAIKDVKAICDKVGARLLVVALPIDVQVSPNEWKKYGTAPIDMTESRILLDDVVAAARSAGAEGINVLPALEAAEPGAFLDGDIHMSAKGHRAVADAIAKVIGAAPAPAPREGLPPGRSWPPVPVEWSPSSEILARESDPAGCETKVVREWLGIFCRHKGKHASAAHSVSVARGQEVSAGSQPGAASLVAPLFPGQSIRATFTYEDGTRELQVDVDESGKRSVAFGKPAAGGTPPPSANADTTAFCACATPVFGTCSDVPAAPDTDCVRTYATNCTRMLGCAFGDPAVPPRCNGDEVPAGAAQRCVARCEGNAACKAGTCQDWQGARVCL